jgi:hypothetical protein
MTMAATQDRACSTSLMNKGDEALKRLATSAIDPERTFVLAEQSFFTPTYHLIVSANTTDD